MSGEIRDVLEAMRRMDSQLCSRSDRAIKNASWWILGAQAAPARAGWGDLSFGDLARLAALTRDDEVVLIVPEQAPNRRREEPTRETLLELATFVLHGGSVRFIDRFGQANRLGALWFKRGYRRTRTGRVYSTGRVRMLAITPEALAELPECGP
jgi:hypothetical protein